LRSLSISKILLVLTASLYALPNPSIRSDCSSNTVVVTADFLAWFASQEPGSIYADVVTRFGVIPGRWEAPGFDFRWDYGFRIGAGSNLAYDQWDTAFSWTWFRTDAKHRILSNPDATVGAEFFAAFLSFSLLGDNLLDIAQSMRVSWSLLYNMFDWELGRAYWVSKDLSMRPFIGVKGGWIHQSIGATYGNLAVDTVATGNTGKEHLKNNFWGIGPSGGVNTKWRVRDFGSHFFDLFGDFSLAGMWGTWTCKDAYRTTVPGVSAFVNAKNSSLGALMCRGFVGIGWDADFRMNQSHFAAKLGYEMQIWFDQMRFATFQIQRTHYDLTLQGVTLNCRLDY
jgi:hypothetical protein